MGYLMHLIKKEVKDLLREPHILIFAILLPALMYIIMGTVISGSMEAAVKQATTAAAKVAVMDLDRGSFSALFIKFMESLPMSNITLIENTSINNAIKTLMERDIRTLIIIPRGFSTNISRGLPSYIESISIVKELSLSSMMGTGVITGLISGFSKMLLSIIVKQLNMQVTPEFITEPIRTVSNVYIRNKLVPSMVLSNASGMVFSIIFVPLIVIGYVASISATSMGVEKEEKTLEVLLTLPVNRFEILLSKLIGSFIISVLASISAGIGFWYYMYRVMSMSSKTFTNRTIEATQYGGIFEIVSVNELILAIIPSLLVTIIFVALIGFIAGALAQNIRSAQSVAGFIWLPLFMVIFPLAYLELASMDPVSKILIALMPFSPPVIAVKVLFSGEYYVLLTSIVASVAYFIILLYVAARLLSSERLLLGIRWKRTEHTIFKFRR